MEPDFPYSEVVGQEQLPPMQMPSIAYQQQQSPAPDTSGIMRPAGTPEELEDRKAKWAQVLSDPNFLRALGMMGQHLGQPVPFGQNKRGHLMSALGTGQAAFQLGEYDKIQQDRQKAEDARKQAESTANIESTQANTKLNQARLPGVTASSKVEAETADDRIAKEKIARKDAEFRLSKAEKVEQIDALSRELEKRKLDIQKGIPDETLRKAALAEVEAAILKLPEAHARIAASNAAASASTASAKRSNVASDHEQITVDTLNEMKTKDPQEFKEFLTKTGRYATHVNSATVARDMYGSIYDGMLKSSPNDSRIKGKTREQFVLDGITAQKSLDAMTSLKNYSSAVSSMNLDPDLALIEALTNQAKAGATARVGGAAAAGGGTGGKAPDGSPAPAVDAAGYKALKKGSWYTTPTGIVTQKTTD